MLLSLLFTHQLPLAFRWEELVAMAGAVALVGATIADGMSKRWEGLMLIAGYAGVVAGFLAAGNR
jgi:Ca2+/H+ antiporter